MITEHSPPYEQLERQFALHKIEAAKRLQESQTMLARTEGLAQVGSWQWDIAEERMHWSDELFRIFQRDPTQDAPSFTKFTKGTDLFVAEDAQRLRQALGRCLSEGTPYTVEVRAIRMDGEIRHCMAQGQAEIAGDQPIRRLTGSFQDITEHKQTDDALRGYKRYLQAILKTSRDGFCVLDTQGIIIEVNDGCLTLCGYTRHELLGLFIGDIDTLKTPADIATHIQRIITKGSNLFETIHRRKDGSFYAVEISSIWLNENGGRIVCFCRDLSNRRQREEQCSLQEQMLNAAPAAITIHDLQGRFLFANHATAVLHGYGDASDILALNLSDLDVPGNQAQQNEHYNLVAYQGEASFEVTHCRKDGSTFLLEVLAKIIVWEGQPAVLSIATDITKRKKTELALLESEKCNRLLSDLTIEGILLHKDGIAISLNASMARMVGFDRKSLLNRNFIDFVHPDDRYIVDENIVKDYALPYILRLRRKNGEYFFVEVESRIFQQQEETYRVTALRDITKRKQAEDELHRQKIQLQQIIEILPLGLWVTDEEGKVLLGNPMGAKIWAADPDIPIQSIGPFKAWQLPSCEPVKADQWAVTKTLTTGVSIVEELLEIEDFAGKKKTILNSTAPIFDSSGSITGAIMVNQDISDRITLEHQLLHAQKLESIGRLAGGVAHDFNNMLGVILGYAEILLGQMEVNHPFWPALKEIQHAAQHSADLTGQLLAFARKQTVAPKVLDLNKIVTRMLTMLRRLIGKDLDLAWRPGANLEQIKMDPSQLDQILTNLCVNARDAIEGSGTITIETSNVVIDADYKASHAEFIPGDYVLLAVSDTGCGIDSETFAHLFEPFFTTKEIGRGTGLGLPMIYGSVNQNNGFIEVCSELGVGSTFKIFLPQAHAAQAEQLPPTEADQPVVPASETILLVEDDPMILDILITMLAHLGYTVLPAPSPKEATRLAKEHAGTIHLLLTDVIMPGMNGLELTKNLLSLYPQLKQLFMSGYTFDVIAQHGMPSEGINFIQKPFSLPSLDAKLREALER